MKLQITMTLIVEDNDPNHVGTKTLEEAATIVEQGLNDGNEMIDDYLLANQPTYKVTVIE